jgi:glutaminyl-peptide cyclotransferase
VNRINPKTGSSQQIAILPKEYFGEGMDYWNGKFVQLTWKEKRAFIWAEDEVILNKTIDYKYDGWGITHDQMNWIASDGSHFLRFLDPDSMTVVKTLEVKRKNINQSLLNELEYANSKIYANIYRTNEIVRIDPGKERSHGTACIDGVIHLDRLFEYFTDSQKRDVEVDENAVLNGIAYNSEENNFYVTGKRWPFIFKLSLVDPPQSP